MAHSAKVAIRGFYFGDLDVGLNTGEHRLTRLYILTHCIPFTSPSGSSRHCAWPLRRLCEKGLNTCLALVENKRKQVQISSARPLVVATAKLNRKDSREDPSRLVSPPNSHRSVLHESKGSAYKCPSWCVTQRAGIY